MSSIEGYFREWNKSCNSVKSGPATPAEKPKTKKQQPRKGRTAKVIFTAAENAIIREELAKGTKMLQIAKLLKRETQYQTVRTHIHEIEDAMKKESSGAT